MTANAVYCADNLEVLRRIPDGSINLIYIDPPFNTQRTQRLTSYRMVRDPQGDRTGFGGQRYRSEKNASQAYSDQFADYAAFLRPRLEEARRVLAADGSLYCHIDYREAAYVKIWLDEIFGRDCFRNEIIWAYDYGAKPKDRWPAKHDNIYYYVRDPLRFTFNIADIDREPYMAPGLVGEEKARRGKLPTDTWWHSIVGTNSRERTGYPTQKPRGVIDRIIRASSNPGDLVLDFFAGSGTVGESCWKLGRRFILVDHSPAAWEVMRLRLRDCPDVTWQAGLPNQLQTI